jgi:hypothetical protein
VPAKKPAKEVDPNALKRERAGRYLTADGRFAVEGESSGSWYVVDTERQNDFGMPVMEGPFATLDAARDRVRDIRSGVHVETAEPLLAEATAPTDRQATEKADGVGGRPGEADAREKADEPALADKPAPASKKKSATGAAPAAPEPAKAVAAPSSASEPTATPEPVWLARLDADRRAAARHLLAVLERVGIDDPSLIRRDVEGNVPEVAATLLAQRVRREALDIWRDPDAVGDTLADLARAARGHLRAPTEAALAAARGAIKDAPDPEQAAAFAWAVAARTALAVFEAIDGEGHERRVTGDPGWRLVELDGRREPTGRTITLDASDLLESPQD